MIHRLSALALMATAACSASKSRAVSEDLRELTWRPSSDAGPTLDSLRRALGDTRQVSKVEAYSSASFEGTPVLVAKFTTGSGTGWHQTEYRAVANGRVVWRALAEESAAKSEFAPTPTASYHIQSCLLAGQDTVLAYVVAPLDSTAREAIKGDSTPQSGLYSWSKAASAFQYVSVIDDSLMARCVVK